MYYFSQFSLYRSGESEFYETWEQVLMAFLNKKNKISFLNGKTQNMVPQLSTGIRSKLEGLSLLRAVRDNLDTSWETARLLIASLAP